MRARYIIGLEGAVDPTDRGIAYGDGLFETILISGGVARRLGAHLDRLTLGCDRLALPMPDLTELGQQIAAATQPIERGSLKLILTRGPGPRGYLPPADPNPTVILLAQADATLPSREISLATLDARLAENRTLAGIKHLNRLEQVLARLELVHRDADEGLMLSTRGLVIGGTCRNLFAVFGDSIRTPAIDQAGIAGVMRRTVLERCAELALSVTESELSLKDIHLADELFMTNALVGIQSVSRLDQTPFASQAVASRLRQSPDTSDKRPADNA